MAKQEKRFIKLMDQDSDPRAMSQGFVRAQLNSRISPDKTGGGASENVLGNVEVTNQFLPSGTNKTIGSIRDMQNDCVYYFNYNSLGEHGIYAIYPNRTSNNIEEVLRSSVLNFRPEKEYMVTGAAVVAGELLYWTDNYNPPRKINIKKANRTGKQLSWGVYFFNGVDYPLAGQMKGFIEVDGVKVQLFDFDARKNIQEVQELSRLSINKVSSLMVSADIVNGELIVTAKQIGVTHNIKVWIEDAPYKILNAKVIATNHYPYPLLEEYISRVKNPPKTAPTATYENYVEYGALGKQENIQHYFRFRTRVVYDDNEKSTWGPISFVTLPANASTINNALKVNINCPFVMDERKAANILRVEVAVQSLESATWLLAASLDRNDIYALDGAWRFYNEGVYPAIDNADITRPYDFVPLKSQSLEYMQDRIFEGGITEGYDPVAVEANLLLITKSGGRTDSNILKGNGQYKYGIVYSDDAGRTTFVNTNNSLNIRMPNLYIKGTPNTFNLNFVKWQILNPAPSWAKYYQWVRTSNLAFGRYFQYRVKNIRYGKDDGTYSYVNTDPYVILDLYNISDEKERNRKSKVTYTFQEGDMVRFIADENGDPFAHITPYEIDSNKSNALSYLYVKNTMPFKVGHGSIIEIFNPKSTTSQDWFFEIGEAYEVSNGLHKGFNQDQKGSWRFTGNFVAAGNKIGFTGNTPHGLSVGDEIIIRQDAGYLNESYNGTATVTAVMTPTNIQTDLTVGIVSPISPGTIHVPASGVFKAGDTWLRQKNIPYSSVNAPDPVVNLSNTTKETIIESEYPTDNIYFTLKPNNQGRVHVVNKDGRQMYRPTTVRFSGKYIEGSKFNELSRMDGLNEKQFSSDFGLLQKLQKAGYVLIGLFDNSESVSMYIEETIIQDQAGSNLVAVTDKVISTTRELKGGLGTQNPESVVIDEDDNVYFWDGRKGEVVSRAENGLHIISGKTKFMRNYFRKKREAMSKTASPTVIGVWDKDFGEYILTFIKGTPIKTGIVIADIPVTVGNFSRPGGDSALPTSQGPTGDSSLPTSPAPTGDSAPVLPTSPTPVVTPTVITKGVAVFNNPEAEKETLAYNKDEGGWTTFYSFLPEMMTSGNGKELFTFLNGKVYRHNTGGANNYNVFYNVRYPRVIKAIGAGNPSEVKVWLRTSVECNKPISMPVIENERGQLSKLRDTHFEEQEGIYSADLLRDINTPNISNPLLYGDDMRSETLEATIVDENETYCKIFALNLYYILSHKTNK